MKFGCVGSDMAVLSVSLPDDLLGEADSAITAGAFKGRSEFVRAAVRELLLNRTAPRGKHVHGSLTILYPHDKEARVSDVRHAFHDVVLSLMHTHCEAETCMDVLIVGGAPERVQALADTYARLRDVQRSRLIIMA